MRTDAAIIGAGPAGSTLAALLARRGVATVLIDRDTFPRDKLCGEFLSYDALPVLDRLGVTRALDERRAPEIAVCRVVGRKTTYEFELPRAARGVSRLFLDDLLLRSAAADGARDRTGWTATRISSTSVDIERNGETETIRARVVIGAWGRWGRFDAQLARHFVQDRTHRNFGFKRHYRALAPGSGTIDLYSFDRGYLGVSPLEGGLTNICGLVHASRLSGLKGRWDSFVTTIRSEERALDAMYARHEPAQDGFLSSEPVIFRPRSPVVDGIVMVGDASGIVDPLTGSGMAMAIQSALVAAPFVTRLLAEREASSAERGYRAAHHDFFAPRIRWSRGIARLLSHPAMVNAAMRAIRSPWAGRLMLHKTRADEAELSRMVDGWF